MADLAGKPASFYASTGGVPQNGAWYSGQQYWNGTLGAPNIIINPNQKGYQQPVSSEVVAQSSAAQGKDLAAYLQGQGAQMPTSAEQVSPYLNDFQNAMFQQATAPAIKVPTLEELKATLAPSTALPAPLNRLEERKALNAELGVADLEKQLTDIKTQTAAEESMLEQKQFNEEGKPVPMGVISGRQTEEARQSQIKLNTLNRQKAVLIDELNTKYSLVNTYMQDLGLDYEDAVQSYDREFSRNMQVYDMLRGIEKDAISLAQQQQENARANLGIYINAVTKGNLTYDTLPADQKLMLNKLEIQSGLPAGFVSSLTANADANIVHISDYQGKTQILTMNKDGKIESNIYGTGGTGTGTLTTAELKAATQNARSIVQSVDKGYVTVEGKMQSSKDYYTSKAQPVPEGDTKLSAEEYLQAVKDLMTKSGVDFETAKTLVSQSMTDLGYSKWVPK